MMFISLLTHSWFVFSISKNLLFKDKFQKVKVVGRHLKIK